MEVKSLSDDEYKAAFTLKMCDVTETAVPVLDIWPYVDSIAASDLQGHSLQDGIVESVYRTNDERIEHVLVMTNTKNVYLVIVINRECHSIHGHRLLDLNKEYGLS